MPYTIRLFKTTIMVLEYIFPSIIEVVWKYVTLQIRKNPRFIIAKAAVTCVISIIIIIKERERAVLSADQSTSPSQESDILICESYAEFVSKWISAGKAVTNFLKVKNEHTCI